MFLIYIPIAYYTQKSHPQPFHSSTGCNRCPGLCLWGARGWGRCGEDIQLRSERENYLLELGVLVLKALLFQLNVRKIILDTLNNTALTGNNTALVYYCLSKASN